MTPSAFLAEIIDPGVSLLERVTGFRADNNDRARLELLAVAGQESGWVERVQVPSGDARGFFQNEVIGIRGVLQHPATDDFAKLLCQYLCIPADENTIYQAIAWNDFLAVGFARLILYPDPAPLPAIGDIDTARAYYERCWHPGKPDASRWKVRYLAAQAAAAANILTT